VLRPIRDHHFTSGAGRSLGAGASHFAIIGTTKKDVTAERPTITAICLPENGICKPQKLGAAARENTTTADYSAAGNTVQAEKQGRAFFDCAPLLRVL
jgi:hypothetical protein